MSGHDRLFIYHSWRFDSENGEKWRLPRDKCSLDTPHPGCQVRTQIELDGTKWDKPGTYSDHFFCSFGPPCQNGAKMNRKLTHLAQFENKIREFSRPFFLYIWLARVAYNRTYLDFVGVRSRISTSTFWLAEHNKLTTGHK